MHKLVTSVIIVAVWFTPRLASADLISVNDPVFGPDSVTRDTINNLDYLNLTFTRNMSVNEVLPQLAVGGTFQGWSYATEQQITSTLESAGLPNGAPASPNLSSLTLATQITGLLGGTFDNNGIANWTDAFVNDGVDNSFDAVASIAVQDNSFGHRGWFVVQTVQNGFGLTSYSGYSVQLVRAAPEPSSLMLTVIGTASVGLTRLRRPRTYI
jgi:hypothetical protein